MIVRYLAAITVIASLLLANELQAQPCQGYQVEAVQSGGDQYDPAAAVGIIVGLRLIPLDPAVSNCGNAPVEIVTEDGAPAALGFGGSQLGIAVQQSSKTANASLLGAKLTGNARSELIAGGVVVPLYEIAPGQFVTPGSYRAALAVKVGQFAPVPVSVVVNVGPAVRFVPENGSNVKSLSFGEVSQGAQRSSSIYYLANGPFEIRITSQNRGQLLHELGSSYGTIDYRALYDGQELELGSGPTLVRKNPTNAGVQIDNLSISIAPQDGKYAGRYTDVLTLDYIAF